MGFLFLPPLGLFLGLGLGHLADLMQQRRYVEDLSNRSQGPIFQDDDSFIPLVFTLYGRITAQTGGPTDRQIAYLENLLDRNLSFFFFERDSAVRAFNAALENQTLRPEDAAAELTRNWFLDSHTLLTVFRTCLELAALNQPLRPGVQDTLVRVARTFGFDFRPGAGPQDFRTPPSPQDDYSVLGLRPDTPAEEIKKRYRTLVRQYHPDSLSHLPEGDPKKKEAQAQFIKVQEAYNRIKAARGIS